MRLPYLTFANVVERARRETLREHPEYPDVAVIAYSVDASVYADFVTRWGEFYLPNGPIVIWQGAYELMPDQENYYRQIKAVLCHEYEHAMGEMHEEPNLAHVGTR